jgi:uncharacterized membrane protein
LYYMEVLSALGTSSGLGFSSGINAYVPLLVTAIIANPRVQAWLHINTNRDLSFLSQDWVIAVLVVLVIAEFVADKVPGVSGLWNGVHTIIRPVTGALAAGSVAPSNDPMSLVAFLVLGASLATMSHTTKVVTRTTASAASGGVATPILGFLEDLVVWFLVLIAIFASLIMLLISLILVVLFIFFAPRIWGQLRYHWRVNASFLAWMVNVCVRRQSDERPTDVYRKLSEAEKTHLHQEVLNGMTIRAGVRVLWVRQRDGTLRGKRRVALPTWLLMTDEALIFFPPSRLRQVQSVPYVEVEALKLKKQLLTGMLRVRVRGGQEYTCTILRTSLSAAVESVKILYTHFNLPSGKRL